MKNLVEMITILLGLFTLFLEFYNILAKGLMKKLRVYKTILQ